MRHHEEDPLLKELLGGEEMSAFRRASLERGLKAVRDARRRRNVVRIGGIAVMPLLLALVLFIDRAPDHPAKPAAAHDVQASNPAPSPRESAIRYIGDDELFALFPGRSLALIGAPGHQELVFLDQPANGKGALGL